VLLLHGAGGAFTDHAPLGQALAQARVRRQPSDAREVALRDVRMVGHGIDRRHRREQHRHALALDELQRLGRIGPNAIIQTCAELSARPGASDTDTILRDAGIPWAANAPPSEMVSEEDVRRLFLAVERRQPAAAAHLLHAAGHRTARYLLANRIPRPVQWLLRCLPARPGAASFAVSMARRRKSDEVPADVVETERTVIAPRLQLSGHA
jgi:hypothetical protein